MRPAIRRQQAGDQAQQQRLADAVGTEDQADALTTQFEIEAVEDNPPGRRKAQGVKAQRKHQPYLRAAQQRRPWAAALRAKIRLINTRPRAIDNARSPLLVSSAIAVVITRV